MLKTGLFATFLMITGGMAAQPAAPYCVPEYAPTQAVLIEWDFNTTTWPLYSDLIAVCRQATAVVLVVRDEQEQGQMTQRLNDDDVPLANISFVHVPCERMWIRDHGPFAVQTASGVAYLDFNDKAASGLDEPLPTNLAALAGVQAYQRPWIFDGGNLLVDSHRRLFCTDGLYTNNPGVPPAQIDADLTAYMGITQIVRLRRQHDDYWAHIDMQAKLLDDTTLVLSSLPPSAGPNYDSLEFNYGVLSSLLAPNGQPYRIERLPMADNWKTYANALILNDFVIVPTYDHPYDTLALNTYAALMPGRTVVGINSNKIIGWEGAIHCITMQLFDETQVTALRPVPAQAAEVSLWPNPGPAQAPLHLEFALPAADEIDVQIMDASGRILWQQRQHLPAGPARLEYQPGLSPGMYQVAIRGKYWSAMRQWLVLP